MAVTLTRGAFGLSVVLMVGCAQGYQVGEEPEARGNTPPFPTGGLGGPSGGTRAMNGQGSAGIPSGSGYQGDACMRGDTEPCTCDGDMGEGMRFCRADADSPTEGSFSDCEQCVPDEEPMAGSSSSGGSGGAKAGSGGRGGSGGSSSSGSAGRSSSGGSAGRGSTGGGSTGSQPWCVFVPIPLPGLCNG